MRVVKFSAVLFMAVLVLFLLVMLIASCFNNKYEGYTPAVVVSTVEYDGKPVTMGCKGDFKCDKGTLECVYHFHKEAQNNIDNVKFLVNEQRQDGPIITELYNALCNLQETKLRLDILRQEDIFEWSDLEDAGFNKQVSMVSSMLIIKIRQLERR
tara:strand:- start:152 stop:616 length:465 start_codon:yes stop_codon:yes gene_type:complete